jgi:galactose mutarotase-like enzyme
VVITEEKAINNIKLSKYESYPGDLSVQLTYTLSEENELIIEYQANSSEDILSI